MRCRSGCDDLRCVPVCVIFCVWLPGCYFFLHLVSWIEINYEWLHTQYRFPYESDFLRVLDVLVSGVVLSLNHTKDLHLYCMGGSASIKESRISNFAEKGRAGCRQSEFVSAPTSVIYERNAWCIAWGWSFGMSCSHLCSSDFSSAFLREHLQIK